jgi:uncharacterized protein (TIGR00369 family)
VLTEPIRGGFPEPGFYSLSGLDQARARLQRLVPRPPLSHLVGHRITQVGPGSATVTMPATPWLVDSQGVVQLSTLIEEALSLAALTGVPPATEVSTATMSTNYLRPATVEAESFVARARIGHSGRTYTLADVNVEDAQGRTVAQSTASVLARPMSPPPPPLAGPLQPVAEPVHSTPDPFLRPLPEGLTAGLRDDWNWRSSYQAYARGERGGWPALELLDLCVVEVGQGRVSVTIRSSEWFCSRCRLLAPGLVAWFALTALGGAVLTALPTSYTAGVLNVNLSFLQSVPPDGRDLLARGWVVHQAGDLLVSSVEVTDADGNRVALGQETAVWREPRRAGGSTGAQRALRTVFFTDIVGSTERAEALGDTDWRRLLEDHQSFVRRQLELFYGREVKSTGDGFLATFDSPAQAIHCGRAVREGTARLGLGIRVGIHTGECELVGADIAGIAVHVASRLLGAADPGEILVSGTVHELVAGSGIHFTDRGLQDLKGIEGKRQVFSVQD